MTETTWKIKLVLYRQKGDRPAYYQEFALEIPPEEYVLDAVERVWAFQDRSLTFRHACHHSTCGACGMRVDGVEKLTCITRIADVTHDGGTLKVEPLRNFPVISDLTVDLGPLYQRLENVGAHSVLSLQDAPTGDGIGRSQDPADAEYIRLSDCIECGLCISACPVAATNPEYLGPAALAAAQLNGVERTAGLLELIDHADGVWRCHSAFECTEVCPSFVEPAWRIMDLRKQVVVQRIKNFFGAK